MTDDMEILDPQGIVINIGGRAITVRPLVIRDYRKMTKDIAEAVKILFETAPDFDLGDPTAELAKLLPAIMGTDDCMVGILAIALDQDKDWIESNLTLEDVSKAIPAIIEANGLERIIANFSRVVPLIQKKMKME